MLNRQLLSSCFILIQVILQTVDKTGNEEPYFINEKLVEKGLVRSLYLHGEPSPPAKKKPELAEHVHGKYHNIL